MAYKISLNYSPNFDSKKRKKNQIKYLIIHYTGMKSENAAIKRLTDVKSNVSCNYLIKKNGDIIIMVPDLYSAWHAGKSSWKNYQSLNKSSIGIEIANPGHSHGYKQFSNFQIISLIKLSKFLIKKYKINLKNILGHSDIAPERKKDPGEKFPWKKLASFNLAIWHKISETNLKKNRLKKLRQTDEIKFLKYLYTFGYKEIEELNWNLNKKIITKAFQRRFRQSLINGIPDKECLLIIKNLLKS